ncbi:hypothetical protein [Micromonospora sediminicola]|uniref:hypothetical protein n=1 Tax=Micromonospora sediminicola TaxID=946078 RepID=UPI0033FD1660
MTVAQPFWAGPGLRPRQPVGPPAAAPTIDPIGHRGTPPARTGLDSSDRPGALPA